MDDAASPFPPPDPARTDPQRPGPALLRWAYAQGVFPMADPLTGAMEWYCPDPRGIIPLDAFNLPRSVRRILASDAFRLRTDTAFEAVVRACAAPRPEQGREASWIDDRIVEAYAALHAEGDAHSVEAWREDELVGGLYGVHLGGAFFGESMFSRPGRGGSGASKVCLAALVALLRAGGFTLLDVQFHTPHLAQFGCVEIARDSYLRRLSDALARPGRWPPPGDVPPGTTP